MKKQLLNLLMFLLPLMSMSQVGGHLNLVDMENPPYTYQFTKFFLRSSGFSQTPVLEYYGLDAARYYMDSLILTKLYAFNDPSPVRLVSVNSNGLLRSFAATTFLKSSDTTGKWLPVGTYIPDVKRQETYLGTSDGSGNYTVTYSTAYPTTPDVQPQIQNATVTQSVRITSTSTTGFTVQVTNRAVTSVLGIDLISGTATAVSGASVSVLVTAR